MKPPDWTPPDPDEFRLKWTPEERMDYVLSFLSEPATSGDPNGPYDQCVWIDGPPSGEEWDSLPLAIECGLTGCPFGWTVMFAGAIPSYLAPEYKPSEATKWTDVVTRDGVQRNVLAYAAELLNLSGHEWDMSAASLEWDEVVACAEATRTGQKMLALRASRRTTSR